MILATAVTGVMAGVAGIALTLLLHAVQHAAFGYTEEAFLTGVEQASAARRVTAMAIGGAVVGTGWWALWRYSRRFPAVGDALTGPDKRLPLPTVTADAALQIIAVGFGASLGREGAPRQVGAAVGGALSYPGPTFAPDAHADVDRGSLSRRSMPPVPPTERETFRNRLRWRASPPATGGWAIDQEAPTDALTSWPALTYSARFGSGASNQAFGGANAVGSLSPKAVTISLFFTSSATPFCCAEAYW